MDSFLESIFAKKITVYSIEEKKQLVVNFWSGFTLYCKHQKYLSGRKKKWLLHRTKINHVHLKFDTGRDAVQVVLEIMHRNEEERLNMYEKIEQCKSLLEDGFKDGLIWDFAYVRDTGQEVCRIYTELKGVDLHRQSDWGTMYPFMAENMFKLERNLLTFRDLLAD